MIPAGDGLWSLPTLEHDDEWFAYASTAVARSATGLYGIPMTALREHAVGACRICELEIQAPQWTAPTGTRWIASSDLAATALEPARYLLSCANGFEQENDAIPIVRPPWERRGWYAGAVHWILSECSRLGYAPSRPVEQLKAAWSSSSILRINTSAGDLYFKAVYSKRPSEPAVIDALAKRWPRNVPTVVAANHDRGWMLMRDFGERTLDREPIARWQAANRIFSGIQLACSADLDPWWRLQCPDLRIPVLVACMERLLGDAAALRIDEPGGLTTAAATRLREIAAPIARSVGRACQEFPSRRPSSSRTSAMAISSFPKEHTSSTTGVTPSSVTRSFPAAAFLISLQPIRICCGTCLWRDACVASPMRICNRGNASWATPICGARSNSRANSIPFISPSAGIWRHRIASRRRLGATKCAKHQPAHYAAGSHAPTRERRTPSCAAIVPRVSESTHGASPSDLQAAAFSLADGCRQLI